MNLHRVHFASMSWAIVRVSSRAFSNKSQKNILQLFFENGFCQLLKLITANSFENENFEAEYFAFISVGLFSATVYFSN